MSRTIPTRLRPLIFRRTKCIFARRTYSTQADDVVNFAPNAKYPITKSLAAHLRPTILKFNYYETKSKKAKDTQTRRSRYRGQVVSPGLCDDIISFYGPYLEQHKGCDILDINPGAGIWSSKLHDFLKPRSHILLESEPDQYKRYLQPLLDQPGSRYKLVDGDFQKFETYNKLVEDGMFPHQERLKEGDSRLNQINNSMLVTGSFLWDPPYPGIGYGTMFRQLALGFAAEAWHRNLFHVFGQARMLFWSNSEDSAGLLPTSMTHLTSTNMLFQMLCSVTEVAASSTQSRAAGSNFRGLVPTIEELVRVSEAMERNGIRIPDIRQSESIRLARDFKRTFDDNKEVRYEAIVEFLKQAERDGISTEGLLPESVRMMIHHEKGLVPEDPIQNNLSAPRIRGKKISMERASQKYLDKNVVVIENIMKVAEDIYKLEHEMIELKNENEKEMKQKEITKLTEQQERMAKRLPAQHRKKCSSAIDERLSLRSPVPRLEWDKRQFQPLLLQPYEAWPLSGRVSLIDLQPKPVLEGHSTMHHYQYFTGFLHALFERPEALLTKALEGICPGASELIAEVPAINDPRKGGRLNVKDLRVRMLTIEMVDGLCKAFRGWPFQPEGADRPEYFL